MSLLLDALKKAEREQLRHAAVLYAQDARAGDAPQPSTVPLLQHGIYVPRSAHDHVVATDAGVAESSAPAWQSVALSSGQPDYVAIKVPGDGLWRFYLVLASMLVVLITVGTYGYYRYLMLQYPTSPPVAIHVPDTAQAPPAKLAAPAPLAGSRTVSPRPEPLTKSSKTVAADATLSAPSSLGQATFRIDTVQSPLAAEAREVSQQAELPVPRHPVVVVKKDNDNIGTLLTRAYRLYVQRNYGGAQVLYEEVLRIQQTQRDALLGLAAIALHAGQTRAAIEHYRVLLGINPIDESAVAGLVSALQGDDPEQARQVALQAVQRAPRSALLHFTLGTLYISMQRWRDAQLSLQQAVSLSEENADYRFNLGVAYDRLGDSGAALQAYRQALRLATTATVVGFRRSEAEKRIQQLATAE